MAKIYPAHIIMNGNNPRIQAVNQHCERTGLYAAAALREIGLAKIGEFTGKHHDFGKCKEMYRGYLEQAAADPGSVLRGSVNHTFAGVRFLLLHYHTPNAGDAALAAELLAYTIGAHHGLFDCFAPRQVCGFEHRLKKENIDYQESVDGFQMQCFTKEESSELFDAALAELTVVFDKISDLLPKGQDDGESEFYLGLLARLLLSALIEGDRRDTAEFMSERKYPSPPSGEQRRTMWQNCLSFMEKKLGNLPSDRKIQIARRVISDQCAAFAKKKGGIIRLNVPTGGGKTLSSLRFALSHAAIHNNARIIFASSLLSVLDQNAAVIRDYIPDPSLILEHHSNVVQPKGKEAAEHWEMLTEQWSAPIIITTLVQLLNTMFAGETSCIRRFHALANSIIVIDEVQTVPTKMMTLFNLGINFLSEICGATVVLCSATQPELNRADHPIYCVPREMVPRDDALWDVFRRTTIRFDGNYPLEQIPAYIQGIMQKADSLLVVCNTKKEALRIYQQLQCDDVECYHLSASICMAHRRKVLEDIQYCLDARREDPAHSKKVLCISTQVIEAGVDISFGSVVRFAAGLDSVVQAAGRCNRNGECSEPAPVYVINCTDETLGKIGDIKKAKAAFLNLMNAFETDPSRFGNNPGSDEAIAYYYQVLYRSMDKGAQDFCLDSKNLDCTLYDLLSENQKYAAGNEQASSYYLHQAFKTAGENFTVFDEITTDVIVPYDEGKKLLARLFALDGCYRTDYDELGKLLQQAKAYTISLYSYQLQKIQQKAGISELFDGRVRVLLDGYYDDHFGFDCNHTDDLWEV